MKKRFALWISLCCIAASISIPCHALEYTFDAPDAGLFGRPTSVEVISVPMGAEVNIDRSKNAAYIPPTFGSQTSYTMFGWERLTPNFQGIGMKRKPTERNFFLNLRRGSAFGPFYGYMAFCRLNKVIKLKSRRTKYTFCPLREVVDCG